VATGEVEQLTDGRQSIGSWALASAAERHVFTLREPGNPGDVWLLGTAAGSTPTRATRVFDYLRDDFRLPRQETQALLEAERLKFKERLRSAKPGAVVHGPAPAAPPDGEAAAVVWPATQ